MHILAIDTSCDETSVAVTDGRKVLSNVIYSQVLLHKKWGGVVPSIAKRAHEERINFVVESACHPRGGGDPELLNSIDYIAVTQGPGLAVALEVGIKKAKELAKKYRKKLIAVNHLEGHIYSAFVQNSQGNPKRDFNFPYLALIISGGHTEFVIFKNHFEYEIIGQTLDDAAGEALDKAAKLLGLGYPGGPVLERLAKEVRNKDGHNFPRPMLKSKDLNFSFSGLKTSFYYFLKSNNHVIPVPIRGQAPAGIQLNGSPIRSGMTKESKYDLRQLASSFQEAVFDTLIKKTEKAIKFTTINQLIVVGGVVANFRLRKLMRDLVKKYNGEVLFPSYKYLTGDNAAMIGIVAGFKAEKSLFVEDVGRLDRIPRMSL
ncbi:tRNA (adenosine(37)-N6)-threonylcarbamoyltransferase complex transferase subunit TsaD [Candidatus Roizmanbacteria bacterium CG22_combo_CG10-13_8_21_14_all_34_12]|uniref:tRNA N6-adenosine threonylcarbamoyltransferase n=1 Tax=Candidatus Roizmanbacteria bacterium CG22_combo_CG10-13_8_21_14_all_34_12 TaxID=1974860 RepID=A0A2H0C1N7_9BACT|nr:MAG: tRNA (adenosine(37)-N6)-threonylcarbamoyltransferase complex transferase subunit TsaD [Candidatus Roizmanbacteria bacterium CG22_combo_CG10-13_8_21_14_all_34_12]